MIKIYPKSSDVMSSACMQGYELMHEIFNDLVFCGNLAGSVPAGTDFVLIDARVDDVRESAMQIWRNSTEFDFQPDDLIAMKIVRD